MKQCVILVDNTNLFIGGKQLSAKLRGLCRGKGEDGPAVDSSWRFDFEGLLRCLARGRKVHAAIMVGSALPDTEAPWEEPAREAGFTVIVHDRFPGKEEKEVDTEIVARGAELIATADHPMVLVIASGDRDYVPLLELAQRNDWQVEVRAFKSSYDRDGELASKADRVIPLDDCFEEIGWCDPPEEARRRA